MTRPQSNRRRPDIPDGRREALIALGAAPVFALDVLTAPVSLAPLYGLPLVMVGLGFSRAGILRVGIALCGLSLLAEGLSRSRQGGLEDWLSLSLGLAVIVAISLRAWVRAKRDARAEHAVADLERSDADYRMLFETIGAPIWVADAGPVHAAAQAALDGGVTDIEAWLADPEGGQAIAGATRLTDANDAAGALFGVSRSALTEGGLTPFRTGHGVRALARLFGGLFRGLPVVEEEVRFVRADGRTIDVIVRIPQPAGSAGWSRIFVSALDVTERRAGEARLDRAQSDLARASRVTTLGQLAASIAHELRQPLTAVASYGRAGRLWLARETTGAPETLNSLEQVVANAERAGAMLDRIRDMVGGVEPRFAPVDPESAIREAAALLGRELESRKVELDLRIAPDLPWVLGDRIQLQQVLINLMMNAVQAMSVTAVRVLTVRAETDGEDLLVEVVDTGPGFGGPTETAFEPLSTTRAGGMGMGLSICRSIMAGHGGTIRAQDAPGGGARLSLRLPRRSAAAAA